MQKQIHGFQLSPQQRRLWLLQQDSQSYQAYCAILLEGNLQYEVLKAALHQVVNRHEILRTTFHRSRGIKIPIQVINQPTFLSLNEYSWENQEALGVEIEQLFQSESQRSFDWEKAPLLQTTLATISPQKHLLLVSLPALCADTPTLKNLVCELSKCYAACLRSETVIEQPLQYAEIAEWQNELLKAGYLELETDYWGKLDISSLSGLRLTFANQQTENSEFQPQWFSRKIAPDLVAKINAITPGKKINKDTFFITCWQILLWRLTEQSDIVIGTACDGRGYEELQESLGLIVKYLPLRCHLEDDYKFNDLLVQVAEATEEISEWQESFCWEKSVELGNSPEQLFFPFCFDFESLSAKHLAGDVYFSIYQQYTCVDKFQVKLTCVSRDDSIAAEFHYDANVLALEDIQRLANQFETLLASVVNNPEGAIATFNIISPIERQQLLAEFNNSQTTILPYQCIHHWFELQSDHTPENIAVRFQTQQLTYAELNTRANQLAHYLQKQGVGSDVLVGICVERSLEMVIGVLGILKAGGAYVPIDPIYPKERQAFILGDTQAPVLLTQQSLVAEIPTEGIKVICLDTDWEVIADECAENPTSQTTALNLAYVIYTSGSTGKPKGTLIPHQGLVNYLNWCTQAYAVEQGDGTLVHSSLAFDLTITSLFSPLLVGCRVDLLPEDQGIETLSNSLRHHSNLSLVKITPVHLELLNQQISPKEAGGRTRAFIIGGENLLANSITFWQKAAPDTMLVNEYGPTETVVGCCIYKVPSSEQLSGSVPIGHPIANTKLYVLNQHCQLVPIGMAGELYIGGLGIARGYLHRPDLTAEKFVPNPFSNEPGERLYKTGDLVRYRADGTLEFLGRRDDQVKIRGFRIELGEIESVLSEYSGVQETVVIAREDVPGNQRLVAYIVWNHESPSLSDLRSFLKQKLPEYMMPSALISLKALPLTSNGKVDRRALPTPDTTRPELEATYAAPHTAVEEILAQIWSQVLGVDQVGIYDNFFDLGGDSILSIQVIAKAKQAGIQLTTSQIFDHQTIAELAAVAGNTPTIQAQQEAIVGSLPVTPIQAWFLAQNQPDSHHWNQSIQLEVNQELDPLIIEQALQQLLIHHDALRLRFMQTESGWQQFNASPDEILSFIRLDLSVLSPEKQESAIEEATEIVQASLNLSSGPLLKVAFFELGVQKSARMLVVMHHLVVDGVSWRILLDALYTVCQQLSQGEAIKLPLKTTSFQRWSQRLEQYAQSAELKQELPYWLSESRKYISSVPMDNDQGDNLMASAETVSVKLSAEETKALLQELPQVYLTQINDLLITAVAQTLAQWNGERISTGDASRSLLIDLEGHGREDIFDDMDLSLTVGWFTTIFPVVLELGEEIYPENTLKSVKEQLRKIPNQGIGYGVLRYMSEDVEIVEQLQALPQAQVIFNYLGQLDRIIPENSEFRLSHLIPGLNRSPRGSMSHLLECIGFVMGGQLQLDWIYSKNIYQRATIEGLAQGCVEVLRALIVRSQSPDAFGYTPSDFPDVELSQEKLEKAFAEIDFS
ncbi:amino acid adenylation domain-containing protein [uncultured Nostoc sp.]|uniref:amino acid adenylation domain-containing protein n=1 Tax=uncultured Nostoc sp. TaxID=340711 RepID=UPI0035CB2322